MLVGLMLVAVAQQLGADERRLVARSAVVGFVPPLVMLGLEVTFDAPIMRMVWNVSPPDKKFLLKLTMWGHFWTNACASVMVVFIWPVMMVLRRGRWGIVVAGLFASLVAVLWGSGYETGVAALGCGFFTAAFVYGLRR